MTALLLAGGIAATFSAATLGAIQTLRWVKWRQKPDWVPALTWAVVAIILWIGATKL